MTCFRTTIKHEAVHTVSVRITDIAMFVQTKEFLLLPDLEGKWDVCSKNDFVIEIIDGYVYEYRFTDLRTAVLFKLKFHNV